MSWEVVIGLEVHAQLKTRSKFLSPCPLSGGSTQDLVPNTFVDALSLGLPGTLPVPNAEAIRLACRLGLVLSSKVNPRSRLARKHYFYPDLPKGYQVSQGDEPICLGGSVPLSDGHHVPLIRIHLEEDAGKIVHDPRRQESRIDLNRAGVPLVEIVSEPVIKSPKEAVDYLKSLHQILTWYGISDGDMEAGNFRCDANVSLRPLGSKVLGVRSELKNINSFRFVERALESEIARHRAYLEEGRPLEQETRGYDEATGKTYLLRKKENQADYRYMNEPDLGPLLISPEVFEEEQRKIDEAPLSEAQRDVKLWLENEELEGFWLLSKEHYLLAKSLHDEGFRKDGFAFLMELLPHLTKEGLMLEDWAPQKGELLGLHRALSEGKLTRPNARKALMAMLKDSWTLSACLEKWGGELLADDVLLGLLTTLLEASPSQVADYHEGKTKVLGYFVGQIMKESKGKVEPALVKEKLLALLSKEGEAWSKEGGNA